MKIIRNNQMATWTLVPISDEEKQIVASIATILKPEDKLSYGGRQRDDKDDKFCVLNFHVNARQERQTKAEENHTITRSVYIGGIKLVLRGSTEEDKHEINRIRDTCYFGSGCLIFLDETEIDDHKAIVTTAKRCKHCNARMIQYYECGWSTCDACAKKCEHNYVHKITLGGGTNIGVGEFCDKCGRGNISK